jgi:hypothetical protein
MSIEGYIFENVLEMDIEAIDLILLIVPVILRINIIVLNFDIESYS